MEINRKTIDDKTCVVELNGTLNATSADQVKDALREAVDEGMRQIVLDLGQVPFIDSSGLTALVSGLRLLNSVDGSLRLADLQSQAKLLFNLTKFDEIFDIYDDADAAVAAFAA